MKGFHRFLVFSFIIFFATSLTYSAGLFGSNPFIAVNSSSGNVGIGVGTPSTTLEVDGIITATGGNSSDWNTAFEQRGSKIAGNQLIWNVSQLEVQEGSGSGLDADLLDGKEGSHYMDNTDYCSGGTCDGGLNVSGSVRATSFIYDSDERLKANVNPIPYSLNKILGLEGVYFNWKNKSDSSRQVGLIAQDVEKVMPELVYTGPDGYKGVNYAAIVAPLIEAVKEQQNKINFLEKRIANLEKILLND